ncbi:hypothetical protein Ppa06_17960 [Planomonospora parontospora subsp. parontospora]|uniref:Uncharacterized protein n=2 Tax=Planomonospora parontospora TaxID=58119 RepID=A0AA37F3M7_9ACTN|nr:hypothetical protein GCM10010126_18530 [Planomonospora parontospora]GII07998.1 hypothetical protein Ppa06_17960 [Planomonospora parontospora subsp. parontospora]
MGTWFRGLPPSSGRFRLVVREAAARLRRGGVRTPRRPPVVRVTERTAVRLHRAAAGLAEVTSEVNAYAELLEEKAHELRTRARDRERAPGPPASRGFPPSFPQAGPGAPQMTGSSRRGDTPHEPL